MSPPGAATSGLSAPSPTRGPRLEKPLSSSCLDTLATASASSAAAGVATVSFPPKLPAATTNSVPCCRVRVLSVSDTGSVPSVGPAPRLMLTTFARMSTAAHAMPARTPSIVPSPLSSSTLPTASVACGASPRYLPADAAPDPVIVEATCVPCPLPSSTVPFPEKSLLSLTFPARSGWSVSMPVSSTATRTPWPVRPACHAAGAPICGTLSSRLACTLAFNHTFSTPAARCWPPASSRQKRVASDFCSSSAVMPRVDSVRATVPTPAGGAEDFTSNGMFGVCASSYPCRTNPVTLNSSSSNRPDRTSVAASAGITYWSPSWVYSWIGTGFALGAGVTATVVRPLTVRTATRSPVISVTQVACPVVPGGAAPAGAAAPPGAPSTPAASTTASTAPSRTRAVICPPLSCVGPPRQRPPVTSLSPQARHPFSPSAPNRVASTRHGDKTPGHSVPHAHAITYK